jgi:hypothetical protein
MLQLLVYQMTFHLFLLPHVFLFSCQFTVPKLFIWRSIDLILWFFYFPFVFGLFHDVWTQLIKIFRIIRIVIFLVLFIVCLLPATLHPFIFGKQTKFILFLSILIYLFHLFILVTALWLQLLFAYVFALALWFIIAPSLQRATIFLIISNFSLFPFFKISLLSHSCSRGSFF